MRITAKYLESKGWQSLNQVWLGYYIGKGWWHPKISGIRNFHQAAKIQKERDKNEQLRNKS